MQDEQAMSEWMRQLEQQAEQERIQRERAEMEAEEARRRAEAKAAAEALEADRQAFQYEERIKGIKQRILNERQRKDPGGYTYDGKHRHLFEVSDEEAEQRLRDDEAKGEQQ